MDALSRMNKAPVTLPSWEQVNILRDPPSSIHTRKKERVSEGDVTHNIREMKDRTSDNILRFARGQNPMVSVSYSDHGGNKSGVEASNPYKVMRDGAFRPPMFRPIEDLQPLSRQKFERPARQTAKSVNVANFQFKNLSEQTIDKEVLRGSIVPRTTRNIAGQAVETYVGNTILDPLQYSVATQVSSKLSSERERDALSDGRHLTERKYGSVASNKKVNDGGPDWIDDRTSNNSTSDYLWSSVSSNKKVNDGGPELIDDRTSNNSTSDYLWSSVSSNKKVNDGGPELIDDRTSNNSTSDYLWSSVSSNKQSSLYSNTTPDYRKELKRKLDDRNGTTNLRGKYTRKVDVNGDLAPEVLASRPVITVEGKRSVSGRGSVSRNREVSELQLNRPSTFGSANRSGLSASTGDVSRTNSLASSIERLNRPRYGAFEDRVVIGARGPRYNIIPHLPNKDPRKGSRFQQPSFTIENENITNESGYGPNW